MKKITGLLFAILFMAIIFITSPAKAQTQPCNSGDPTTGGCPTGGGSSNMPINSGVIYLLVTGAVIGVIAIKKRQIKAV